jgi:hypothetical protein
MKLTAIFGQISLMIPTNFRDKFLRHFRTSDRRRFMSCRLVLNCRLLFQLPSAFSIAVCFFNCRRL